GCAHRRGQGQRHRPRPAADRTRRRHVRHQPRVHLGAVHDQGGQRHARRRRHPRRLRLLLDEEDHRDRDLTMFLTLLVLLIGAGIAVVVFTLLTDAEEKAVVRSSLRQLEGYEVENVRDQELLVPLRQRALVPLLQGLTGLGQRLTPVGYVDGVRQKFIYAGRPNADTVDRFLAVRVITVAAIPLVFILAFFVLPLTGNMPV